jgi:Bacterial archaeo-eukaryotic release factor family 10
MRIDRESILAVAEMRDPAGIVSIYVDVDPAQASSPRPRWIEDVRVELERLECTERLHELRHRIADAVDPARHGRGRALFFGASAGSPVRSFGLQMPLETSVTMSDRARLQPLLEAFDSGRPAGIVVVSMAELRAIELAWGEADDVLRVGTEPAPAEWSERKEPNRLHEEDRLHIVRSVESRVEKLAHARGWDRIVLAGNLRLARPLGARIAGRVDATVVEAMRQVLPEDHAAHIATQLGLHLADADARRAAALLERAHDAAFAGGTGAAGVDDVLAAVTEGRAQWVAIDAEAPLRASGVQDPERGVRLLDRVDAAPMIIDRALATRAAVSVLSGRSHPQLAEAGALALLRW